MTRFNPGDPVYIVLRDDTAEPAEYAGFVFIAQVQDVVLAAPGVCGHRELEWVLCYLMHRTEEDDELPLVAVPVEDCYHTLEEAKEAYASECED